MTHQEIKKLAGHRAVSPWIMKLVNDAVEIEREACAKECEQTAVRMGSEWMAHHCANAIRARGQA